MKYETATDRIIALYGTKDHHHDLIYSYKIIFRLIDVDCSRFFTVTHNETTRVHASKLFVHLAF